jgi:hypothetical protein
MRYAARRKPPFTNQKLPVIPKQQLHRPARERWRSHHAQLPQMAQEQQGRDLVADLSDQPPPTPP